MSEQRRRRIDNVLDPAFVAGLESRSPEDLREKLREARTEEDSLSYVRRNLHGRLDLLRAELELRLGGRGTTRSVDVLASALSDSPGGSRGGRPGLGLRAAAVTGRRGVETVISEDHLARLPDLSDLEIEEVVGRVADAERVLSDDRQRLFKVIDAIEAELAVRYKRGLEPSLDRLQ
jgi:anti-sigma-K factor RsiG